MLLIEQENEETNFKLQKISVVNNVEIYTYFFVVIQHSIHVFDPDSVNGTIKNYPLSVRSFCGREFSERFSHNTVTPLKHKTIQIPLSNVVQQIRTLLFITMHQNL